VRVGLIVRGGVEEGTEASNAFPVFVELIRRLARDNDVQVFSLHGERRASSSSIRRSDEAVYQFAGASVFQLGTTDAPRLRLLSDVARVWTAVRAAEPRWGAPQILHGIGMSPGIVAASVGRILRVPSVVSLIGGELTSLPEFEYGELRSPKGRAVAAALLRGAGTITVASRFMQDRVERHGAHARLMPFGIDVDRLGGPIVRRDGPPFRLLHVGTLCAIKDQLTLVRAVRELVDGGMDVELDVAGWDDWNGRVQREAAELQLRDRVRFHGWIGQDDLIQLRRRAHAFVMASRDDVAPVAVLEAAAAGLPVVGTDVGFIADWAPDAAIRTPVGDPGALAHALRSMLSNQDQRERLAANAQHWVRRNASLDADDAYARLYHELTHVSM
jgi:glycosyltransferase involved in cell wall biosynthesis